MVPLADTSVAVAPDLSDPFAEGGLAWFRDKTELDCPYPIPGRRAALWLAGSTHGFANVGDLVGTLQTGR